ncbi:hypothetical protein [Alloactinosynnema sp. L-07]|uniref:hypothetical protein n=1 Tax=Alloactinosynnema sp. L-07 TaxID=1653480 RepID=UPI00065F072E|nr:hypothetical protein [Alloactinosynnema sp. L-07]CRK56922.1 hypothetical protein [Alloactinosynnema sp. L-07]
MQYDDSRITSHTVTINIPRGAQPPAIHVNGEKVDQALAAHNADALGEISSLVCDVQRKYRRGELELTTAAIGDMLARIGDLARPRPTGEPPF